MTADTSHYDKAFFDVIDRYSLSSAEVVVPLLRQLVPFTTVVDVGCGRGAWLRVLSEHGADTVVGYDGAYVDHATLLIPASAFRPVDLSRPLEIGGRYDLAVCLEVAEHLPRRVAGPLVQTLCKLAPAVLFSAAIPGQGGTHHINEQWPHYWEQRFVERGFLRLDPFRRRLIADERVATHYKQNLFLYVDRAAIDRSEALTEELRLTRTQDVTIIAVHRLTPLSSVTGVLGELWRTVTRSIRNRLGI